MGVEIVGAIGEEQLLSSTSRPPKPLKHMEGGENERLENTPLKTKEEMVVEVCDRKHPRHI